MNERNDENLLPDLIKLIQDTVKKSIDTSLPCEVTKVISRTKVNVRPLIKIVDLQGNSFDRDIIEGVPVQTFGAGDTLMSFPLSVGSLGWIDAAGRDLGLFLQTYESEKPSTARMHSFSDARFVPDIMHNFTVSEEDETALVIQNRSGTVKIALDQDAIRIKTSGVEILIDGNAVSGIAPGGFNLNGFTINGSGAAQSPVSLAAPSALIGGKEMAEHDHPAGEPPDNTGPNN
jgi:hypothetical protein